LLAQKKEQEKGTRLCRPPEAVQTGPAFHSVNSSDAQRHRMGYNLKIEFFCRFTQPSTTEMTEKGA